eukprot:1048481-Karenia_brevis.AAC.1
MLEKEVHKLLCNTIETAASLVQAAAMDSDDCQAPFWLATSPHLHELVMELFSDVEATAPQDRLAIFVCGMDFIAQMLGFQLERH